ncbi:MAG: hypothetical protein HY000_12695 [Planctomycetes bacterium]|nr:hypothetical protein [Planctomycetota bacterium]
MLHSHHEINAGDRPRQEAGSARSQDFPEHDSSGVDLSLLRWMLRLTPLERLEAMERRARDYQKLLEYGRQHRETPARQNR